MSIKLYGDKIKKDFRKSLFIDFPKLSKETGICYALAGVPENIQKSIKGTGKKNIIILNNSVIKDIIKINDLSLYSETLYFESVHAKYTKKIAYTKDYLNTIISKYKLPPISKKITHGSNINLIILDNIGGWYLNKKNYIEYISQSIKLLKSRTSLPIEIRLHPKNREDKNITKTIKSKFKNINFNTGNIVDNLDFVDYYVANNSHLAYYYFYNGCKVMTLSDKALYYNYGYQLINDQTKYINCIHNLFNEVFHHTLFFDGTENKQLLTLIQKYHA